MKSWEEEVEEEADEEEDDKEDEEEPEEEVVSDKESDEEEEVLSNSNFFEAKKLEFGKEEHRSDDGSGKWWEAREEEREK